MNYLSNSVLLSVLAVFMAMLGARAQVLPIPGKTGPKAVEDSDITVKVEYFGQFPNDGVNPIANMNSPVSHAGRLYGIDQQGVLYRWSYLLNRAVKLYDRSDAVADGIDIVGENSDPFDIGPLKPFTNVVGAKNPFKLYVLFQTNTPAPGVPVAYLPGQNPKGATKRLETFAADLNSDEVPDDLNGDGEADIFPKTDIYNISSTVRDIVTPFGTFKARHFFHTLYEFTIVGYRLYNPRAIVSIQGQASTRHDGGALAMASDGRILMSTGDSQPAGFGGRAAPQQLTNVPEDDINIVGKVLLINPGFLVPADKVITIAAIGSRNAQHFQVVGSDSNQRMVWGNIGRFLAEEINSLTMDQLLSGPVENLGWGCDSGSDGHWAADGNCQNLPYLEPGDSGETSREGTFKIRQGIVGGGPLEASLGFDESNTTVKPLAQVGRFTENLIEGFAISGPVISDSSFETITALFGDLPSGRVYAITDSLDGTDVAVKRVNLVDENGNPLNLGEKSTLNAIPIKDGECELNPAAYEFCRVDPRFFTFPSGSAGVILERTGKMYRLTEVKNRK